MALLRSLIKKHIMFQIKDHIVNNYSRYKCSYILNEIYKAMSKYKSMKDDATFIKTVTDHDKYRSYANLKNYYIYDQFIISYKDKKYVLSISCHFMYDRYSVKINRLYEDRVRKRRKVNKIKLHTIDVKKTVSNDCQIRTLATVTDQDYDDILKAMTKRGWTAKPYQVNREIIENGKKTIKTVFKGGVGHLNSLHDGKSRWDSVLKLYNLKKTSIWVKNKNVWGKTGLTTQIVGSTNTPLDDVQGSTVKTACKYLTEGKYVIEVKNHVCTIVDGKLFDSWNSSNCHVQRIYKIEKI